MPSAALGRAARPGPGFLTGNVSQAGPRSAPRQATLEAGNEFCCRYEPNREAVVLSGWLELACDLASNSTYHTPLRFQALRLLTLLTFGDRMLKYGAVAVDSGAVEAVVAVLDRDGGKELALVEGACDLLFNLCRMESTRARARAAARPGLAQLRARTPPGALT